MANYISKLPDDIFYYILSLLTVRDTFRVKSLSSRWKDLPDCRSVLEFDAYTILGQERCYFGSAPKSKFVKAIDQFLQIWRPQKTNALKIKFDLGNEYASHIDGWIASVTGMGVEALDLDFSSFTGTKGDKYVFPCHLLYDEKGSFLKHLQLKFCDLTSVCDTCTIWPSKLSCIELANVSMSVSDMEYILSNSLNLESLSLINCGLKGYLCLHHRSLKKLSITEDCEHIELSCSRLEMFTFSGCTSFTFSNVSLLREASLDFRCIQSCSSVFSALATNAPQLQILSLYVRCEVQPLPPNATMSCLKQLNLHIFVPMGFDLFCITHLLYASPVLEALHLRLSPKDYSVKPARMHIVERSHFHLKEVKIEGVSSRLSPMKLVEYLLRNGVSLQQMVLVVGAKASLLLRSHPKFNELQNVNPVVDLIAI